MKRFVLPMIVVAVLVVPGNGLAHSSSAAPPASEAVPALAITVSFTSLSSPVAPGHSSTAKVHTTAGASCTIVVTYQDGPWHGTGLGRKIANAAGNAAWTWVVPANTTAGLWPVKPTCTRNGHSASARSAAEVVRLPPVPAVGVTVYPAPSYGSVDCLSSRFNEQPYWGNLKRIKATADGKGVEFDFCNPDPAFLGQIASAPLAIQDAGYLIAHAADGRLLTNAVGTGPYRLKTWDPGNSVNLVANPDYWGVAPLAPKAQLLWNDQSAARLVMLQAGTVDGMDNPTTDDMSFIADDPTLAYIRRPGLNTFYLGMNNTYKPWDNVKVRRAIAMGINRSRIVRNFYGAGSEVANYFTPCPIPYACGGEKTWSFNPTEARRLLAEGLAEDGMTLADWNAGRVPGVSKPRLQFRSSVRPYMPDAPTIAHDIQVQLRINLGIKVSLDLQESNTFLDNNAAGKLDGLFMLGWVADYPDTSGFVDYFFGTGAGRKFGNLYPDLWAAVNEGDQATSDAGRAAGYAKVNNLVRKHVPLVIVAHGGTGTAWRADVEGAYSSSVTDERFALMEPGNRATLRFVQMAEPLSLYCADETDAESFRACEQIQEPLFNFGADGLTPEPALATSCTPNADFTVWTCALRKNVKFSNGAALGPDDVILSFAAQWDGLSPLHVGRTGSFEYWPALIGGGDFLNSSVR